MDIVLNKVGSTSFFNFKENYPFGNYHTVDSGSLLVSSLKFSLSRFGN